MGWEIVIGVVIVAVVLWLVLTYNGLVTARNRTQEAWSEIDVELKRRHDLIPNLVNTVQGYMGHERGTLEAVTDARTGAVPAGATWAPATIGPAANVPRPTLVGAHTAVVGRPRGGIDWLDIHMVLASQPAQGPVPRTPHWLAIAQPVLGVQQRAAGDPVPPPAPPPGLQPRVGVEVVRL